MVGLSTSLSNTKLKNDNNSSKSEVLSIVASGGSAIANQPPTPRDICLAPKTQNPHRRFGASLFLDAPSRGIGTLSQNNMTL